MSQQRPSLLTPDANPLDVLCRHFNVSRPVLPPGTGPDLPPTITLTPLARTHLPTHVLAVSPSHPTSTSTSTSTPAPLLLPIDAALYASGLRSELPLPTTSSPPQLSTQTSPPTLKLPLLPLTVPHPPTLALLLLFALGLEPVPPYHLLPAAAVEEFPNAAAMAQVLARAPNGLTELVRRNEGLWKNVLALGVRERGVVDTVGMVWGVTAEARRLRARANASAGR
ncbi:hypothetical protein D9615_003212 [Tricholomella constricta]|uniref:Uncharacterized protein n=1 Tax=Tricholomella constricta TaxID=117010 RepID=A0A8H5HJD4_9AGAR|nr:hypothetical protein D9615_003212 [Tricholomella constricta]